MAEPQIGSLLSLLYARRAKWLAMLEDPESAWGGLFAREIVACVEELIVHIETMPLPDAVGAEHHSSEFQLSFEKPGTAKQALLFL